jgi:hypothetical protein
MDGSDSSTDQIRDDFESLDVVPAVERRDFLSGIYRFRREQMPCTYPPCRSSTEEFGSEESRVVSSRRKDMHPVKCTQAQGFAVGERPSQKERCRQMPAIKGLNEDCRKNDAPGPGIIDNQHLRPVTGT